LENDEEKGEKNEKMKKKVDLFTLAEEKKGRKKQERRERKKNSLCLFFSSTPSPSFLFAPAPPSSLPSAFYAAKRTIKEAKLAGKEKHVF